MWGWGIPSVLKRVAVPISAQIVQGTRVEEPQVGHGVEVRVREWWRHVNVSEVSQMNTRHTAFRQDKDEGYREWETMQKRQDEDRSNRIFFFLPERRRCTPRNTAGTNGGVEDMLPMLDPTSRLLYLTVPISRCLLYFSPD